MFTRNLLCLLIGFGVLLLGLGASPAWATERRVPSQYATIQAGIDAAVDGDTVRVTDDTYTGEGNTDLDFKGKAITVRSASGDPTQCIIDGEGVSQGVNFHSGEGRDSVLSGFTFQRCVANHGGAIVCTDSNPTITKCNFAFNRASTSQTFDEFGGYGGALFCYRSNPVISSCLFTSNTTSVPIASSTQGGAIYFRLCLGTADIYAPAVVNCLFTHNTCGTNKTSSLGGAIAFSTSFGQVINCTFSANFARQGGGVGTISASPFVTNCILTGDAGGEVFSISGGSPSFTYCNISGLPAGPDGNHNFGDDPRFKDPANGDYSLRAPFSPCINAGNTDALPAEFATDLAGNFRFAHAVDVGCYEDQANRDPRAENVSVQTNQAKSVTLTLRGNDPDGDTLTYIPLTAPVHGTLTGTAPNLTYTPDPAYFGFDSFTFQVRDPQNALSNVGTVFINIQRNNPPRAVAGADQTRAIPHDGNPNTNTIAVTLDGSGSSDPDGDTLAFFWDDGQGHTSTAAKPTFDLPAGRYPFTLKVSDPLGLVGTDVIVITVTAEPNRPPLANAGADQIVQATHSGTPSLDRAIVTLNGSASSDPDNDTLTYSWSGTGGLFALSAQPSFPLLPGTYTFTLTVRDSYGVASTDTVQITVNPAPNQAPGLQDQTLVTEQDRAVTFSLAASDPDHDVIPGATTVLNVQHGTLTRSGLTFTYTPHPGYVGPDSFTVYVVDNYGAQSNIATVNISVTNVNDPPTLSIPTSANGTVGQSLSLQASATDPDLPNDTLIYSLVNSPAGASINANTGAITFLTGVAGIYSLAVKVTDLAGASDTKTIAITIASDPATIPRVLVTNVVATRVNASTVSITFALYNAGLGEASSVKITSAKLKGLSSSVLPGGLTLPAGNRQSVTLTFSGSTLTPGTALFQVAGSYLGGTFSAALNLTLP